jgi:hypothetical protein
LKLRWRLVLISDKQTFAAMPIVILTEGEADDAFIKKLIEDNGLGVENFIIRKVNQDGGCTNFWKRIRSIRTTTEPMILRNCEAVVIIADNDGSPAEQFAAIRNQIEMANQGVVADDLFGIPLTPLVAARQSLSLPPVIVLMLPWGNEPGCLETVCLSSMNPDYAPQLACVDEIFQCVGAGAWSATMQAKFRVQCLLSSICTGDPYTHLKYAWKVDADKGRPGNIFLTNNSACQKIVDFLRSFIA